MKHFFTLLFLALTTLSYAGNDPEINLDPLEVTFYNSEIMVLDNHYQQYLREQSPWQSFLNENGTWYAHYNEQNQKPHRAYGQPISTFGATAEEQALNFINDKLGMFNIPAEDLSFSSSPAGKKYQYVNFTQKYQGVEILNSRVMVKLFNGQAIAFGADVFTDIEISVDPTLDVQGAIFAAEANMFNPIVSTEALDGLKIIAVPGFRKHEYKLVYEINVNTMSSTNIPANYNTFVDANTGEIVYRANTVMHIDNCPKCKKADKKVLPMGMMAVSGHVTAELQTTNPYEATSVEALPFLEVNVGGETVYTDVDGNFTTTADGPSSATIPLRGLWSTVFTSGITPSLTTTVADGFSEISYDNEANVKELSAYRSVNLIHDHMKAYMPDFTDLDYSMTTNIDIDGECNAFYDGTINFFDIGGGCNATSLIADVIYHEYGHGINDRFYQDNGSFFTNGAMGEGYADFWGISLSGNPRVGQGFYTDSTDGIRRYDENPKVYPVDLIGEVHADGEIIMGAWYDSHLLMGGDWDATVALFVETYYGLQATAFNGNEGQAFVDVLLDVLQADDDDGDISNGTPNGAELVEGFDMHGITLISNAQLNHNDIEEHVADLEIEIDAAVILNFPFSEYLDQGTVYYRVNAAETWEETELVNSSGFSYSAVIPAQAAGSVVYYYLGLSDIYGGISGVQPIGAAQEDPNLPYIIVVGSTVMMEHDNDFAEDFGFWEAGVSGDLSTTGDWEFDSPVGSYGTAGDLSTIVAPSADHTPGAGEFCYITENTANSAGGVGANDVDGGHTTLRSADIDLTEFSNPIISYWRWFVNGPSGGANPGTDWWYAQVSDDGGDTWIFVEETRSQDIKWRRNAFRVQDYVDITDEFKMQFIASDSTFVGQNLDGGSLIEAGIDDLLLYEEGTSTGVDELSQETFVSVYPNPASEYAFVEMHGIVGETALIQVIDVTGRVILSSEEKLSAPTSRRKILTDALTDGIYLIEITIGDKRMTEKMTVKG
ncbi:MAG: Zn-dependent metalloprotease [Flavobacteriales bacterium]|jgi:Zn-dependent metalloprotease